MRRIGEFLLFILSALGSITSIISVVYLDDIAKDEKALYSILFIGAAMSFFMVYSVYLVLTYKRTIRYAPAIHILGHGFSKIHDLNRQHPKTSPEEQGQEIKRTLRDLCNRFAQALSLINYHPVAVCIKFLSTKDGRPVVLTLVRDEVSASKNRKYDAGDATDHWIDLNSGFKEIYKRMGKSHVEHFLFERFLPWKHDYQNTRIESTWRGSQLPVIGLIIRQFQWPLPYKSTITVPLVPLDSNLHNTEALRGFLCIDSPRNWAFSRRYDIDMIRGMADGVYNQIDELFKATTLPQDHEL